ncbi:MAG: beta-lactamase family protein [Lachnospiraceae bacterium]|nr:beta-lactamase family protein [Lachnospiraceae bacterium]
MKNRVKALVIAGVLGLTGVVGLRAFAGSSEKTQANKALESAYENGWERAEKEKSYVYCVASISKVYTTAAVMQLVDEGKVRLDAPVTEYLPSFRLADDRYQKITVRMLMTHTSGIMGTTQLGAFLYGDASSVHHDELLNILAGQRLKAEPGKYAAYCNDGFELLEHIVENVTGMSFTDYVKEKLAAPVGATATSTGNEVEILKDLAPAYASNLLYENDATMSLGTGGVYATAADAARFGSAFFTGNEVLLSEKSKKEMGTRWNQTDPYTDDNGLGWDAVSTPKYEEAGVVCYGKGGDVNSDHGFLLVAPNEKISIAVLSNGGSSTLDALVAQALLNVCLEEQGIVIPEDEKASYQVAPGIPASYDEFAGDYVTRNDLAGGDVISRVSFPDHKYMHVENISAIKTTCADYVLTEDGKFAELAAEVADSGLSDMRIAMNPELLSFVKKQGQVLIACDRNESFPGIGSHESQTYVGERLPENPISEDVLSSWMAFNGMDFVLTGDVWSSQGYNAAISTMVLSAKKPGYLYMINGMGTRILKIVDESSAVSFMTIPSSTSRDLIDIKIQNSKNGVTYTSSAGLSALAETDLETFDDGIKEITLKTGEARWFQIGDSMVGREVMIAERPENSAVYVYNKYGEVLYNTHIVDETSVLPMPKGGKIVFLGETDGTVTLQ